MATHKDSSNVDTPVNTLNENVLKRKINLDVLDAKRQEARRIQAQKRAKQLKTSTRVKFVPPEKIIMQKRKVDRNKVRVKRLVNNPGSASKELKSVAQKDAQIALVLRIRGKNGLTPEIVKAFHHFRLNAVNSAVFIKLSPRNVKLLKIIEPYITWGYPTRKTISDLLFKRGHLRVEGTRVPITDNVVIEKHFGQLGIICVEDLVHEIYGATTNLKEIHKVLWPFKLNPPQGKFPNKRTPFAKGGSAGLREEKINDLMQLMI